MKVVEFDYEGETIRLQINDTDDLIQREQSKGRFYEMEEIAIFKRHFSGGVFVDIGSNVGNHTVFALKILKAEKSIVFEANAIVIKILKKNIELNNISSLVDINFLERVVTAKKDNYFSIRWKKENLGAAKPYIDPNGIVQGIRADDALKNENVSYIKIDVEGNELDVLDSLAQTIENCRPRLFVEVDERNEKKFKDWLCVNKYIVFDEYKRYQVNKNYFLDPII